MDKLLTWIGGLFLVGAGLFVCVISGTLIGAIGGWIVGAFFEREIIGMLAMLGVHNATMWQFGAFLGFVGGFFRTSNASPNKTS